MTRLLFATWRPLLDREDRTVGWAMDGRVHDGDDLLVVRGLVRGRSYFVVAADGSLVGKMAIGRSHEGRRTWGLHLGDSDRVAAEYQHRTVVLPGAEGREVATIVGNRRCYRFSRDWELTFSLCEDPRLRLMCLWLLGRLAVVGHGG
jgi:hypothetical protein